MGSTVRCSMGVVVPSSHCSHFWGPPSSLAAESPDVLDKMCLLQIYHRKHVHVRQFVNVSDRAKMNAIRRGAEDPSEDTYMSTCDVTSDMRNETHLTPHTDTPGISPAGSRQMQHMHRSAIPISHIDLIRLRTVVFRSSSAILYVRSSMHVAVRVRGPPPCHRHFAGVIRS